MRRSRPTSRSPARCSPPPSTGGGTGRPSGSCVATSWRWSSASTRAPSSASCSPSSRRRSTPARSARGRRPWRWRVGFTAMADPVRLEREGAVAVLVLDSPPLNLFGGEAFEALEARVAEVEGSDARALVWRAEGDVFTGGADVNVFDGTTPEDGGEMFAALVAGVRRLEALPIPTLALVHGLCLTAGLEVSLGCDLIWATDSARFGLVEAVVGLTPGAGGTQRMAERAGPARAREFVMTRGTYDAATLERWNVVNRVVGDDELLVKGMTCADRLAAGPTKAHAA